MIFDENVKKIKEDGLLLCKCGSNRYVIRILEGNDGNRNWVDIVCKKCNKILFYNGA